MIQRVLAPFRGFVVGRPPKCGLGRADQRYVGSGGLRQNPIVTVGLGNYAETQDQPRLSSSGWTRTSNPSINFAGQTREVPGTLKS